MVLNLVYANMKSKLYNFGSSTVHSRREMPLFTWNM